MFGGGDTLATHGRGGAMRGRRQPAEILITKPPHVDCKQGWLSYIIVNHLLD